MHSSSRKLFPLLSYFWKLWNIVATVWPDKQTQIGACCLIGLASWFIYRIIGTIIRYRSQRLLVVAQCYSAFATKHTTFYVLCAAFGAILISFRSREVFVVKNDLKILLACLAAVIFRCTDSSGASKSGASLIINPALLMVRHIANAAYNYLIGFFDGTFAIRAYFSDILIHLIRFLLSVRRKYLHLGKSLLIPRYRGQPLQ